MLASRTLTATKLAYTRTLNAAVASTVLSVVPSATSSSPRRLLHASPRLSVAQSKMLRKLEAQINFGELGVASSFVLVPYSKWPSVFSSPKQFWRVVLTHLRSLWTSTYHVGLYKWKIRGLPGDKVQVGSVGPAALDLYTKWNTAFADADVATLKAILAPSLYAKQHAELKSRPGTNINNRQEVNTGGLVYEWKMHEVIGKPKLQVFRVAELPDKELLVQCTIGIRSKQSLEVRDKKTGTVVSGARNHQNPVEVYENIVVEAKAKDGAPKDLKILSKLPIPDLADPSWESKVRV
ncbi:hypothetical protein GQ42DRAFT_159790 [Ramicandelaber brevisporus]|nr:hypothetical protein GQ42DRAFT_159790 [Ramicandelaber brevisporus]